VLQENRGVRVDPVRALGLDVRYTTFVKLRIRTLRRQGHEIHSSGERCTGYRYVGQAVVTQTRYQPAAE